ncbi:MAG: hypothetical protein ACYC26_08720 [Phycisphaerales bacterium]
MKASLTRAAWMSVALLVPAVGAQAAGIWDNGGGDNQWETVTNWDNNALPTATDGVVITGPNTAVLNTTQTVVSVSGNPNGGTLTINPGGNLTTTTSSGVSQGTNVFTLNVLGGSLTTERIFNGPTLNNSGMIVTMTGGSINFSNRFQFNDDTVGPPTSTGDRTVVNLSGGTFGSANFKLYGVNNSGNRSELNITGSTLAFNVSGITLANTTSAPASSTALTFTIAGSTIAERSTIAKLNTGGGLILDQNPLTVDFSNYANTIGGNYSMTLIDYNGVLTLPSGTAFASPNFIYGSSGVSGASLVHDATNKLYRVDFSYLPIPEPATLGLLAIGGLMMLPRPGR